MKWFTKKNRAETLETTNENGMEQFKGEIFEIETIEMVCGIPEV